MKEALSPDTSRLIDLEMRGILDSAIRDARSPVAVRDAALLSSSHLLVSILVGFGIMMIHVLFKSVILFGGGIGSILLMSGCSSTPYDVVGVSAQVTCEGKPAVGAVLIFEPLDAPEKTGRPDGEPGVTSRGIVSDDGSVVMMTDARGTRASQKGVLVGPHRVSVLPPRTTPAEVDKADIESLSPEELAVVKADMAKIPVYEPLECGTVVTPNEVEVIRGSNTFTFTLSGSPPRANSRQVAKPPYE